MASKKKDEERFDADLAAAFGVGVLSLDYGKQFGLWLNLNRVRGQRASEVSSGVRMGMGDEELPFEYYDAVCGIPEMAENEMVEQNLNRGMRRLLSMRGR